jgi:hypothetical protein
VIFSRQNPFDQVKRTPHPASAKAGAVVLKLADLLHEFTNSTTRLNCNRKFSLQAAKRLRTKISLLISENL